MSRSFLHHSDSAFPFPSCLNLVKSKDIKGNLWKLIFTNYLSWSSICINATKWSFDLYNKNSQSLVGMHYSKLRGCTQNSGFVRVTASITCPPVCQDSLTDSSTQQTMNKSWHLKSSLCVWISVPSEGMLGGQKMVSCPLNWSWSLWWSVQPDWWELHSGPLEESQGLLTAKSFL